MTARQRCSARPYRFAVALLFLSLLEAGSLVRSTGESEFLTYTYTPRLARRLDPNAANDRVRYNHEPPAFQDCSYLHPSSEDHGASGTITYGFRAAPGQTIRNIIASQSAILYASGTVTGDFSTNNGASFVPFFVTGPYRSEPATTTDRANLRGLNSPTVLIRYTLTNTGGDNSQVQFCRDCNDAPFSLRFDFDVPVSIVQLPRTLHLDPAAGGTADSNRPAVVAKGSRVVLTARPNAGYAFRGWFGDAVSLENPLTLFMDDSKTVTPHFEALPELGGCLPAPEALTHWWQGEGTLLDSVTGKAAVPGGALSFGDGYGGLAINFDGVIDYMVVTGPSLNWPWTVAAWVNRKDSLKNGAALMSSDGAAIKLEQNQTSRRVGLSRNGFADWSFNYSLPTNRWTHLAFVAAPGSTRLYVDGALEDILPYNIILPLSRIGIGKDPGLDLFKGALDELMVFSRALSTEEVAAIFRAGKAGVCKPAQLLGVSRQNGAAVLHVLGSVGRTLRFIQSSDLQTWTPFSDALNDKGLFDFAVPATDNFGVFRVADGD